MKTSDLIKQAEELLKECSDGNWENGSPHEIYGRGSLLSYGVCTFQYKTGDQTSCFPNYQANAAFIVFARNHMRELLDRLKRYEEALNKIDLASKNIKVKYNNGQALDLLLTAKKALEEE